MTLYIDQGGCDLKGNSIFFRHQIAQFKGLKVGEKIYFQEKKNFWGGVGYDF